jgi:hypothetical protein
VATVEERRQVPGRSFVPTPLVDEIVKRWDEAKTHHAAFVRKYERGERAYRGVLQANSSAARWRHKQSPRYGLNLLETVIANTEDMNLGYIVNPSPRSNLPLTEAQEMLAQRDAVADALKHEIRVDELDGKQRPYYLTMGFGGVGILKSYWNYSEGMVRRQVPGSKPIYDDEENYLGSIPTLEWKEEQGVLRDHSTCEVVDPRDFVMHEAARTLQPTQPGGAQYVFHRCWYSYEQLKWMEKSGYIKNVDHLHESLDFSEEYAQEKEIWEKNRTKDMIEVLEYWCFKKGRVYRTLVGNRIVVLREEEANPFNHGEYPFSMSSAMRQPFHWGGISDMEVIAELQEILWELMNQRLDNVELINNAIMLIRSDVEDPEAFEWYPGAQWPVESVDQVQALMPPYQIAEVSLQAEALIKGDLQNTTGSTPLAGGTETATVDQKTATGASLVMSAAQKRLLSKKREAQRGLRDEANQRLKNMAQFITEEKLVHVLGPDGAVAFRKIDPLAFQGEWMVDLEPTSDTAMSEQEKAEALQLTSTLMQFAPILGIMGAPLNGKEIVKHLGKKFKVYDIEKFFTAQPQPQMLPDGAPAGAGPQGPAGPPGQEPNMGITADSAVDAQSPSGTGGMSISPAMAAQRSLAMTGAGRQY